MATLEENIQQAIADFDDIEAAIKEQGVEVPSGTDTSEYGNLIRSIEGGSGTGENGGYYTPTVTQPSTNTMKVSYTPSKSTMPSVAPVTVTLPAGKDGSNGKDGADGKTPVKGVDYYTEADKQEMVNAVLAALPNGDEVSY